jgi:predicted alpha/beta superfamily hydrolase
MKRVLVLALMLAACGGADGPGRVDAGASGDAALPSDGGSADASEQNLIDTVLAALGDASRDPAALDALFDQVAQGPGWPLHLGQRWLFVRRWDGTPASAVLTGDWVSWSTTALPVTVSASGAHVYVLIDQSAGDSAPSGLYKWWAGDYQSPPDSTAYGYDEFGLFGYVERPATVHLERFPGFASATLAPRTIRVLVPEAPARTLLLHDGQNVFDPGAPYGGWRAAQALAAPALADVLAVAVDNTPARFDEYTQVADDPGDGSLVGGKGDDYWALIDDTILPFVRTRFGVTASGRSLAVAGSSLGGLINVYGALEQPGRAGCVIAMSSTLGWGSLAADHDASLIERWQPEAAHAPVALVLDVGGGVDGSGCLDSDGDGVNDDGNDGDNYCVNAQMNDVLTFAGYLAGTDYAFFWTPGATHDEAAWAARLPGLLATCTQLGWTP